MGAACGGRRISTVQGTVSQRTVVVATHRKGVQVGQQAGGADHIQGARKSIAQVQHKARRLAVQIVHHRLQSNCIAVNVGQHRQPHQMA